MDGEVENLFDEEEIIAFIMGSEFAENFREDRCKKKRD